MRSQGTTNNSIMFVLSVITNETPECFITWVSKQPLCCLAQMWLCVCIGRTERLIPHLHLYCLIQQVHSSVCLVFRSVSVISSSSFKRESFSSCRANVLRSDNMLNSAGLLWAKESSIENSLWENNS